MKTLLLKVFLPILLVTYTSVVYADTPIKSVYQIPNGPAIYYERHGVGNAPNAHKVLLLHGGLSSTADWFKQIPALEQFGDGAFEVIAVDSRGHGRSTGSNLTYANMANDVFRLMVDRLGINKNNKASVIGWSDGGVIAANLCISYPELIHRAVFIGTNVEYSTAALKPGVYNMLEYNDPDWTTTALDVAWLRISVLRMLSYLYYNSWQGWTYGRFVSLGEEIKNLWKTDCYIPKGENEACGDSLSRIQAPTFVIAGGNESTIIKKHTEYINDKIPISALWIIPGADHLAPLNDAYADEINSNIIIWLNW